MAAATGMDGLDTVDTLYANTRNNPIEDIESHLPLRVTRYEMRENALAPGRWRGGIGSVREFTYLADGGFSVEGEGHKYPPWGFAGGADGAYRRALLLTAAGERDELPSRRCRIRRSRAGDRLLAFGPSGGGYGDPLARDPRAVLDDVLDGYVDAEFARDHYAVVIAEGRLDEAATATLRARRRAG